MQSNLRACILVCMFAVEHRSWIESANTACGFSLNHLPYGAFEHRGAAHLCVAIGDYALDLYELSADFAPPLEQALQGNTLNGLLALGPAAWQALRETLTSMLHVSADETTQRRIQRALIPRGELALVYPLDTRGYVDFYASIDHARRVGELFRPDNPLLPNYKHVPIAYNGRASSLVVSGTPVRRPWGQRKPAHEGAQPEFTPTRALDYELELAFVVGHGNVLGEPIRIAHAASHLFGVALLNDWSARDIQSWEYQPLGPFLGKSFATSLSPWITPFAALEPYRTATQRPAGDPSPLPYLLDADDQQHGALDLRVETWLKTASAIEPALITQANTSGLYWTAAQMAAHASSNGCALEPGDLLATGTISGQERAQAGCLLELTRNGAQPLVLANGDQRTWLEDGDEVTLRGFCERDGLPPLALGECSGRVVAAHRDILPR